MQTISIMTCTSSRRLIRKVLIILNTYCRTPAGSDSGWRRRNRRDSPLLRRWHRLWPHPGYRYPETASHWIRRLPGQYSSHRLSPQCCTFPPGSHPPADPVSAAGSRGSVPFHPFDSTLPPPTGWMRHTPLRWEPS